LVTLQFERHATANNSLTILPTGTTDPLRKWPMPKT